MGDYDYVKAVLDRVGDMRWMQVAIKPAKPLAFGVGGHAPVFGLPGNPVSSMVSFELFARPALRKMMGHAELHRPRFTGRRRRRPAPPARRQDALRPGPGRGRRRPRLVVRSAGGQGSHQLTAMAGADALAVLPDGDGVRRGGRRDVLLGLNGSRPALGLRGDRGGLVRQGQHRVGTSPCADSLGL